MKTSDKILAQPYFQKVVWLFVFLCVCVLSQTLLLAQSTLLKPSHLDVCPHLVGGPRYFCLYGLEVNDVKVLFFTNV